MAYVSSSPHVSDRTTTRTIMLDVIIALLPATIFGIYNFGFRAAFIVVVSVLSCVGAEAAYEFLMKKPITIADLSAVVTGLLIALNMPSTMPIGLVILGCLFGIIVVKQLFGGLGQNFMNPALAARCFLLISFAGHMTNFVYDGVSSATPLAVLKAGGEVDVLSMFIGTIGGTIGETSVIAILTGAALSSYKKSNFYKNTSCVYCNLCYIYTFVWLEEDLTFHILRLSCAVADLCSEHFLWLRIMLQARLLRMARLYSELFSVSLPEYSVFRVTRQRVFRMRLSSQIF